MKSVNYIITPPNLFSGFALENNSFCFVAFVKYQNYEIFSSITLFVGTAQRHEGIIYLTKSDKIAVYPKTL